MTAAASMLLRDVSQEGRTRLLKTRMLLRKATHAQGLLMQQFSQCLSACEAKYLGLNTWEHGYRTAGKLFMASSIWATCRATVLFFFRRVKDTALSCPALVAIIQYAFPCCKLAGGILVNAGRVYLQRSCRQSSMSKSRQLYFPRKAFRQASRKPAG